MKVLVAATHPDDEVLGCGGTIAKYANEGQDITTVIFSYGEKSNILEDDGVTIQKRIKESKAAGNILGSKTVNFFGLPDNLMIKELQDEQVINKFDRLLHQFRPDMIITHSLDDPHPAHAVVARFVKSRVKSARINPDIYTFNIWSPLRLTHRNEPKLVVNTSETFEVKKKALKSFKSQKIWLYYPGTLSLVKDRINGLKAGCSSAEVFYKWKD